MSILSKNVLNIILHLLKWGDILLNRMFGICLQMLRLCNCVLLCYLLKYIHFSANLPFTPFSKYSKSSFYELLRLVSTSLAISV
jgi:hypothetical protein